ncbi:LAMI_0F15852g1_1 [Lachancea mirantina]|uniref:LAMI_0F15852g1_1 n=1 Tax=Lachancea mirantina TaxID=1230905 RepID=A0A1G4K4K2_9SACH|nr:LAMI_0F15852g1_1 [Lachancea mirantina]
MARHTSQIANLLFYITIGLVLIAAVEYFKYSTRIHYEWFHCTPVKETIVPGSSATKMFAVGGPSCDKRGELKTLVKRITRDFETNQERASFCILENPRVSHVHYPVGENKGEPGYIAYVSYDSDFDAIADYCADTTVLHI